MYGLSTVAVKMVVPSICVFKKNFDVYTPRSPSQGERGGGLDVQKE